MTKDLPAPEELRKLLRYDPDTGKLFWRNQAEALTYKSGSGYKWGNVNGNVVLAHRACWVIYYGEWPKEQIDHIDGNPTNNRINNLRDVSCSDNQKNTKKRQDNKSGVTGVSWHKKYGKWQAYVRLNKKQKSLGLYVDFDEAVAARKSAEKKYGYHKNHGRG